MKPKAKYVERIEEPDIIHTIKVLLKGDLTQLTNKKVKSMFKEAYAYLLKEEKYEKLHELKQAEMAYYSTLSSKYENTIDHQK